MRGALHDSVGAVAIGRNEGERLKRCLHSLRHQVSRMVYVDSGSTDGSVAFAREIGAEVVELDVSTPFTAARARNAGARLLMDSNDRIEFIQFIDGDCELDAGFIDAALKAMAEDERLAVVCGRRREREPDATIYNRLCDIEWNTPVGEARSCGGDALFRASAFGEAGGYRDDVIAGEEPELCVRLRHRGWKVRRIDAEMTLHDAAMSRFGQFMKRAARCGHAYAEGFALHGSPPERFRARELRSILFWAIAVPVIALAAAWFTWGVSILAALLLYGVLWWRIARAVRPRVEDARHARAYAFYCVVGKFAELRGVWSYWWNRIHGRKRRIIEYKGPAAVAAREA